MRRYEDGEWMDEALDVGSLVAHFLQPGIGLLVLLVR